MEDTHGNGSIFGGGLETPRYHSERDFLDPDALRIEHQQLTMMGEELESKINVFPQISDEKIARRWDELDPQKKKVYEAKLRLRNVIKASPLGNTVLGANLLLVLEAAERFISFSDIEKQKKLAVEMDFLPHIKDFFGWAQFAVNGEITLQIGKISIKDVMGSKNLSPSAFFKQHMEAQILESRLTHQSILEENRHIPLILRFPNVTKEKIQETAGEIIALWIMASFQNPFRWVCS